MKNLSYLMAAVVALCVFGCANTNRNKPSAEEQPQLPAGAIEMRYQDHLYFTVMLRDSLPARMIFDTGATNLIIDSAFYAENFGESQNIRRAMLSGAGDGYELTTLDAGSWDYSIGEVSHTEPFAIIMNLRKILGDGSDGLFGLPFMQGKRVEFNYADGYMRLLAPDEKIADDFTVVQCKWLNDKDRIILPLSVTFADGYTLNGNFLMDTGMPDELSLNSATTNRLSSDGHLANARRMTFVTGGVGGSRTESYVRTRQIDIGGKSIKDIRISCSHNRQGALADSRFDGLVGNALFARFDVVFDFENCVMYIRPNGNFDRVQPNDFGILFRANNDHWIVNGLLEGGNAERSGLRQGDRIEAINGIRADEDRSKLYPLPDKLTLSVKKGDDLIEIAVDKE